MRPLTTPQRNLECKQEGHRAAGEDAGATRAPDRSAGVPPARLVASSRPGEITIRDRGRLPHWEMENAIYFVTFRLADSLPKSVLERIATERESILRTSSQLKRDLSPDERRKLQQLSTKAIEQYLDAGAGSCHLRNPDIATLVADTLRHFDKERYCLFAWCIMPNHVHVLARIFRRYTLASVLHSWKSFSAKGANQILSARGAFWQKEYYDHLIRDECEFERAIQYVVDNPVKAGLCDWKWVWVARRDTATVAGEDAGATRKSA